MRVQTKLFLFNLIRRNAIFCFLLIFPFTGFTQISIKGVVVDEKKQPVEFCSVGLSDAFLVLRKGTITDEKGIFIFENIKPGTYRVKVTAIGFKDSTNGFFTADSISPISLDTILLRSTAVKLDEIAVTSVKKTIEFKDGMIVMNVENSPMTTGNTVIELLKRMPGVYIDNQNNIFLDGKTGIRILIDGKLQMLNGQQLFAVLSNMSADNISKIELMKNPPAKYDAAGSGGMINIVTKKVKLLGISGSVSAGASKGYLYREGGDGSLNYKAKKLTLFSNFGFGHRDNYNPYLFNKTVALPIGTTYLFEDGAQIYYQRMFYYRAGADFFISDKTTIGFIAGGGPSSTPMLDTGVNRISGYNTLGFDKMIYSAAVGDDWRNPNYNINLEHKFDTLGTVLNFSGDYSEYNGKRQTVAFNDFKNNNDSTVLPASDYRSTHLTKIRILTQKLDLVKVYDPATSIETGVKATFVDSRNDYTFEHYDPLTDIYKTDTTYTNIYQYNENVLAAYLNYKKQFKKLNLQLGGRGENTLVTGKNETSGFVLTRNYFNFFPNLSLDYPISDKHTLQFNLTRRIDRPNYNLLNPYKSYQDNFSSTIGNPYLMPQYSYNGTFTYIFKQTIFNTINYSRVDNLMLGYDYQNDSTKETISTNKNIAGSNYVSYSLFVQKGIKKWWNFSGSGSVYYTEYFGTLNNTAIRRSVFSYNAFINNDIVLPKNFKLQVNFQYVGPGVFGIFTYSDRWALDVGLKKTFLNNKLTFNFIFFDIFYRNFTRIHNTFQNQDYVFANKNDTRRGWISCSYRFGKIRIQKRNVDSNEQEKERLKKEGK